MKVSRNIRFIAILFFLIGISNLSFAKTLRVGIIFDGPSDNTLNFVHDIEEELPNTLLANDKVIFPSDGRVAGKFDVNIIKAGMTQLMINKNVDAILAIGPVASHIAANMDNYPKPVIAAHIYNAAMQKIRQKNGTSGCKNLSYIDMNLDIGQHIDKYQEKTDNPDDLKVPRSTESQTWDFVMREFDLAILGLPEERTDEASARRATKWVAYGLKSRAALYAASVAKFWNKAPLSGDARSMNLVGMEASEASAYYRLCVDACTQIIESGRFSHYKPDPVDSEEAQKNLLAYFQDPNIAPEESMLIFGYEKAGEGHAMDFWFGPWQTRDGSPHPGRMNPSLDLADAYETYSNPGRSTPIVTTTDGKYNDYSGFRASKEYLHFTNAYDIFADKDARMWATFILPFTEWKGKTIRIQAGYIQPDGKAVIEAEKASIEVEGKDGKKTTYHTFGAASSEDYSGFDQDNLSCMTRTGFSFKKFLSPNTVAGNSNLGFSLQDWAELRYAEILLNYAEAVVEGGYGNAALAKECLNATRHRAAFKTDIPLTVENVQRERRVEFAFECKRHDDLRRRREMHEKINNYVPKSLDPVLDLREDPPTFIFIRKNAIRAIPLTYPTRYYYDPIPGVGTSGLVQNPQF